MKRIVCLMLLIILMLCGCSAKAENAADCCEIALEPAEAFGAYSTERSSGTGEAADDGSGVGAEYFTEQADTLIWASFSRLTDETSADDGTKLFACQGYLPSFRTQDAGTDRWLEEQVGFAAQRTLDAIYHTKSQALADFNSRGEESSAGFYAYSYYSSVSTERLDNHVLSVLQISSTYSGGAHPNYAQIAYNMDLEHQVQLTLADVLQPGKDRDVLDRVLNELERRLRDLENFGLFADYTATVESYFETQELTPYWYFTGNGLAIYFNCYDIAPYAAGIIKVEFPYDSLYSVLKPEYFPEKKAAEEGSALLLDAPGERIVLPTFTEGETFYVGTDSIIYDVKIHRLTGWLNEDVPLIGQTVFAANRLTAGEAVELAQSQEAGLPEFLITFHQGDGSVLTYAVKIGETREIVLEIAE